MTLAWSIFAAIFVGSFLYQLITGRISVRLWKTVSRDEEPELYWTIFGIEIMGLLTGVALLLYVSMR
jgi:hypothetical protein